MDFSETQNSQAGQEVIRIRLQLQRPDYVTATTTSAARAA